ncbi:hypothetical protein MMON_45530 [Mycolicibacterium monacense]|uniref:Secreted protein n=1 Tax=Mycolicibacterium monacense TaxID=85693 RepID=A0AAD1J5C8_MYCMB|nr:hypothetical protein MMON_45530 [Mycolicibacterium monacense]
MEVLVATAATVLATWLAAHGSGAAVAGVAGMVSAAAATPPAAVTANAAQTLRPRRCRPRVIDRMALLK